MKHNGCYSPFVSESTAVAVRVTAEIASPEEREDIVDKWLKELDSANTRAAYEGDFNAYADFLTARGIPILHARRTDVADWRESLRVAGRKRTTIARKLAAVTNFYGYCVELDLIEHNPAKDVKRPKIHNDEDGTVWLSLDQMNRLLATAQRDGLRSEVLVAVLTSTGARIDEVLSANVPDYIHRAGQRVLTATIKGGARHDYVIVDWVAELIDTYLAGRAEGPLIAPNPRKNNPGRYTYSTARRLLHRLAADAGIPLASHVSPHSLRHSHITDAREGGASLDDTQRSMRHKKSETTRRYDHGRLNLKQSTAHIVGARLARGRTGEAS